VQEAATATTPACQVVMESGGGGGPLHVGSYGRASPRRELRGSDTIGLRRRAPDPNSDNEPKTQEVRCALAPTASRILHRRTHCLRGGVRGRGARPHPGGVLDAHARFTHAVAAAYWSCARSSRTRAPRLTPSTRRMRSTCSPRRTGKRRRRGVGSALQGRLRARRSGVPWRRWRRSCHAPCLTSSRGTHPTACGRWRACRSSTSVHACMCLRRSAGEAASSR
jgi:hypothetical protein